MVDRTEEDQFIVLACDGIYDVMTNEDVANFVRYHMQITKNLTEICNKIVDTCLHKVRYSTSVLPYSALLVLVQKKGCEGTALTQGSYSRVHLSSSCITRSNAHNPQSYVLIHESIYMSMLHKSTRLDMLSALDETHRELYKHGHIKEVNASG